MSDAPLAVDRRRGIIALWLAILCAMVFVMVVLGGVAHVAGSGGTREVAVENLWTGPRQTVLGLSLLHV